MKHTCALLLGLLLLAATLPRTTLAQTELDGGWMMSLTPPGQNAMTMTMHAETISDTLHLALVNEEGALPLPGAVFAENQLRFQIESGHGSIHCTLYKKDEDTFTGICAGPMGEGATTLKRMQKNQK